MTLIEKLEKAEAGSRELDGDVEVAVREVFAARSGLKPEHWAKWRSNAAGAVGDGHTLYAAEPATTSIDAALALAERVLPEVAVNIWNRLTDASDQWAVTLNLEDTAYAATAPLALCTALLKARTAAEADAVGMSEANETKPLSLTNGGGK